MILYLQVHLKIISSGIFNATVKPFKCQNIKTRSTSMGLDTGRDKYLPYTNPLYYMYRQSTGSCYCTFSLKKQFVQVCHIIGFLVAITRQTYNMLHHYFNISIAKYSQ